MRIIIFAWKNHHVSECRKNGIAYVNFLYAYYEYIMMFVKIIVFVI